MLNNHSHERLIALRLTGMAKAFDDQLRQPDANALTFEQRLGLMIDREVTERENRRLVTRLKFASLRQTAVIEDIDLPRAASTVLSSPSSSTAIGSTASITS
jgi:IstB-like ATP binding protein